MVAGACLVAAFQSRNSFTSRTKSKLASTKYHMCPRSGVPAATILGTFIVHLSNTLFQRERSSLSFFRRKRCSQEHGNDEKQITKTRTFFPLFPSHFLLKITIWRPAKYALDPPPT